MVERTAHNGSVVGSNPARLIYFMELNFKDYKYSQLKKKLKVNQLLLIFNVVYTKNNKTDNSRVFKNINLFKVSNKILKRLFTNSIYFNYRFLINNFIMLATVPSVLNLKELIKANYKVVLLGLKFQKKFYTKRQLQNIVTVNFNDSMKLFMNELKFCIKFLSIKFRKVTKM